MKQLSKVKPFAIEETTLETEHFPEDDAVPLEIELVHDPSEEVQIYRDIKERQEQN